MHYIYEGINLDKYKYKINLISHYDYKTDRRIHVYLSHGAGEKLEHNKQKLNSDYYLCWTKAEYDYLTKLRKKAFLVGSVYNELTTPIIKSTHNALVYIPQHHFEKDLIERCKCVITKDMSIGELIVPYLTKEELDELAKQHNCNIHITSTVDDTNNALFEGHNIMYSNRHKIEHIHKCQCLHETAKTCIIDVHGTFNAVAVNHGIEMVYRTELPKNYDDICTMPMKDNLKLIHDALDEIYEAN